MEHLRTPDEPSEPVVYQQYILTLPVNVDIQRHFWGAVVGVSLNTAWVKYGTMETRDAANYIKEALNSRMVFSHLGTIVTVLRDTIDDGMLLCDGSIYNKVDYPDLWEVYPAAMKDATTLTLPDLQNLFIVGSGSNYSLGDTGGADDVTLTTAEMPSHAHTTIPHSHAESVAFPSVGAALIGIPIPSAIPAIGVTGASGVTVNNAGGGGAHENRPPFYALVYAIIAKVVP